MKSIRLTQGKTALIDDLDYKLVARYNWFVHFDGHNWYPVRRTAKGHQKLHDFLMQTPAGVEIDHKDRNGLNNQRRNLRICTHAQNCANRFFKTANKSGFKGVSWKKANKKWCAQIKTKRTVTYLGLFKDPKIAAKAYDYAAIKEFGEFALTNRSLGLI